MKGQTIEATVPVVRFVEVRAEKTRIPHKVVRVAALKSKSGKAVLATEQRIPGLGNGVLQDILYNARVHPRRKWSTLDNNTLRALYESIQTTLEAMTRAGGRDTDKDLFGRPGGHPTKCSKNTVGSPHRKCGGTIEKQAYKGRSVSVSVPDVRGIKSQYRGSPKTTPKLTSSPYFFGTNNR